MEGGEGNGRETDGCRDESGGGGGGGGLTDGWMGFTH